MGRNTGGEIKFDGAISIGRIFGGSQDEVRIEIEDKTSSTRVLDLRMNFEDFAKAVLGQSSIAASGVLYHGPVGYNLEVKTENIPSLKSLWIQDKDRKEVGKEYLKDHEVDGWRASYDDLFNHHRMHGGTTSVGFFRWVHPETKEIYGK